MCESVIDPLVFFLGIFIDLDLLCAEAKFTFDAFASAVRLITKHFLKGTQVWVCAQLFWRKANIRIAKGGSLAKAWHIGT
ncbi:hypothetical protein LGKMAHEF_04245 [Aeromonas salmonicida]